MTSANPITGTTQTTPPSTSASSSAPSNTLGPNSFITLLTAQLQTQDPLSPMDPNQMVSELTSINTLQQIMQIRSDMDTLVGSLPSGTTGSNPASGSGSANSAAQHAPFDAKLNSELSALSGSQVSSNSQ